MTQLGELQQATGELEDLEFQIVAVSADPPESLKASVEEADLGYRLFTDPGLKAAEAFGLVYRVSPETLKRYEQYGMVLQGDTLPVPAVFLVGKDGKIVFQYANPDYRVRLDKDLLLAAARSMAAAD